MVIARLNPEHLDRFFGPAEQPFAARLRAAGESWYAFLLQRYEETSATPDAYLRLGELYGRMAVWLLHDTDVALECLDLIRIEAQPFKDHPDFPSDFPTS